MVDPYALSRYFNIPHEVLGGQQPQSTFGFGQPQQFAAPAPAPQMPQIAMPQPLVQQPGMDMPAPQMQMPGLPTPQGDTNSALSKDASKSIFGAQNSPDGTQMGVRQAMLKAILSLL